MAMAADVSIEVRNIAGRLVRTIPCGVRSAGINSAICNLRNATGATVPSGTYLCTITSRFPGGTQTKAIRTITVRR